MPWLIRLALRAFPATFRSAYAEEMAEDWVEARAACRTALDALRLTLGTAGDVVASGLHQRRASRVAARGGAGRGRRASLAGEAARDLRQAARALARRPGFTIVAVLTLALGIGANTAIFSVVNAVLLRPLKWKDPDGLVSVWAYREDPASRGYMSLPDVRDIATLPGMSSLVGYSPTTATVTGGDEPELVAGSRSSGGLLSVFELQPYMGRDLTREDAQMGRAPVVVVGYRYWQERLGGRRDVIGSTVEISARPYEVVGVAPPGFDFPDGAQLWWPRWLDLASCGRGCHTMFSIGRLAPDATLVSLSTQLNTLATTLSDTYPESNFGKRFRAVRLADDTVADVRQGLLFILGAVSLVLLIACANVANLLLVRGESRRGEVAVRAVLGASRARLASQVLMESALLSVGGVVLGLAFAWVSLFLLRALPAGAVPRIETVSLDGRVLLFTLGLGILVVLLFGLSPALRLARGPAAAELVSERRGGAGPRASRVRSVMLASEVALSVLLLVGAGLLLRSFDRLYRVDMGFAAEDLTRFRLSPPYARYGEIGTIVSFWGALEDRLRAEPGVTSVGSVYGPPLGYGQISGEVKPEGRPEAEPGAKRFGSMHSVTPGYIATMKLPLLEGRGIEPTDRAGTIPVAVVSETFVKENYPGEDPIGKRFEVTADFGYGAPVWTIVGVVGDVRPTPTSEPGADVYVPLPQYGPPDLTVTMRTTGPPPSASRIHDIVRTLDPGLPVIDLETMAGAMSEAVAPTRFYLAAMGLFAGLAVALACVGLYGVIAYVVSRRGREIGIRIALGARGGQVVGLVLRQGLLPAAIGMVTGVGLSLVAGRVVESLLFDVSPRDPLILTGVVLVLGVVTFAAALLPAIRASAVDPAVALRADGT